MILIFLYIIFHNLVKLIIFIFKGEICEDDETSKAKTIILQEKDPCPAMITNDDVCLDLAT